jgi:hypothetical protein
MHGHGTVRAQPWFFPCAHLAKTISAAGGRPHNPAHTLQKQSVPPEGGTENWGS